MRKMYFNGSFYSNNCNELNKTFNKVNVNTDVGVAPRGYPPQEIKAIIAPHAGYFYSGFTANQAYNLLKDKEFKRIIVLGPSHHLYFKNASIALEDKYQTPCGNIEIDIDYSDKIVKKFNYIKYIKEAHGEHSTETQMPFIKHYLPNSKVIEIVYGDIDYKTLSELIKYLIEDKDNLLVISTDLSHFYQEDEAIKLDKICINAVENIDIKIFDEGCEACGLTGLKALIDVVKQKNLKSKLIDYRTSASASNDKSRVVGYMSAVIF